MNKTAYESLLQQAKETPWIHVYELRDNTPRTLIYGYTCERNTFHLYLSEGGYFTRLIYSYDGVEISSEIGKSISLRDCVPDKRVYPEACDAVFCSMLMSRGQSVSFTNFTERDSSPQFHGLLSEQLLSPCLAKQTEIAFDFDPVGYGVSTDRWDLDVFRDRINSAVSGQASGYLKALLIHKKSEAEADRWLTPIEELVVSSVEMLDKAEARNIRRDAVAGLVANVREAVRQRVKAVQAGEFSS